jgi:hypothetical protein
MQWNLGQTVPARAGDPTADTCQPRILPPDVSFRETIISPDGTTPYTDHKTLPGDPITLEELKREATESSESISKDYNILNKTLKRYEEVIRTRWAKKTRSQRKEILENAWQSRISVHHRPDLEEYRRSHLKIKSDDSKKVVYMWPHINLEDLLTPATIPRYLNSRGRNPPRTFASMDWDSTELGRERFVILERRFDVDEEYWTELETDDLDRYGGVDLIMVLRMTSERPM